jgi:FtsH-binding integral membrane protein
MGIMFIATMCLLLFGLIIMFIGIFTLNIRILYVVYASIGALLFMVWLAIDIQVLNI